MRRRLTTSLLAFCVLSACGTTVIWHGHTPDRTERVVLEQRRGHQSITRGGSRGAAFDGISYESIVFSDSGHRMAYAAREDDEWFVVVDTVPQNTRWKGVSELVLSGDGEHLAYAASADGRRWTIVRDDVPEAVSFDALFRGSLSFDRSGQHIAFAAQRGQCIVAVLNDNVSPCFDAVADLQFAPDEALVWGYLAQSGSVVHAVINGELGDDWQDARHLVFAPGHHAFVARRGDDWFAVIDGEPGRRWTAVHSLVLGADAFAYVGRDRDGARVVEPSSVGPTFDSVRQGSLRLTTGGAAYIAQRGADVHVVRGDDLGPSFVDVGDLAVDAQGLHVAYSADTNTGRTVLVVDGDVVQSPALMWAGDPVWGPRTGQFMVAVHTGESMAVAIRDGVDQDLRLFPFDVVLEGSLAFADDGAHWGAIVGTTDSKTIAIVMDGRDPEPFDLDEMTASLVRRPMVPGDADLHATLRRWVAADITRRAARPGSPTP